MFQGAAFSNFPCCAEYPGAIPYGSSTARWRGIQACPQSVKRVPGPFGLVMPLGRLPIIPGCRLERHSTSFHNFFDPDTVVANEKTPSSPLGAYARIFPMCSILQSDYFPCQADALVQRMKQNVRDSPSRSMVSLVAVSSHTGFVELSRDGKIINRVQIRYTEFTVQYWILISFRHVYNHGSIRMSALSFA